MQGGEDGALAGSSNAAGATAPKHLRVWDPQVGGRADSDAGAAVLSAPRLLSTCWTWLWSALTVTALTASLMLVPRGGGSRASPRPAPESC